MKFKLENKERKYFGLNPIQKHWDEMEVPPGKYDENTLKIYFDGNTIVKEIVATENSYYENDTITETENREFLLPKTTKGKKSKLAQANLKNKYTGQGIYFSATKNSASIASYTTQTNFYSTSFEGIGFKSAKQFETWKIKFIKESDSNYLEEIDNFKQAKRRRIKYQKGDYFSFKVSRKEYGYGKILEDIGKLQDQGKIREKSYMRCFLGPKLLVCPYAVIGSQKEIQIDELNSDLQLPSQFLRDNIIFHGEYHIFDNKKIEDEEMDFPISIRYREFEFLELQWGELSLESRDERANKPIIDLCKKYNDETNKKFYARGTYGSIDLNYNALKSIIKEGENSSYFDYQSESMNLDLRNPKYAHLKRQLFNLFKLNENLGYQENLKNQNAINNK